MSNAIDQTEQACVGNGDWPVGVKDAGITMNLRVLSDNSSTTSASVDDDEFISPRTLILGSRSTEEEMIVSNSKVKSRHKWIEETLLKDNNPSSETTHKSSSRRSLPASTSPGLPLGVAKSPRHSLGSKEDVIARARAAIQGRRQSRETAKAKVSAAMASIAGDKDLSISYSTSSLKENDSEERNDMPRNLEQGTPATAKEDIEKALTNTAVAVKDEVDKNSAISKVKEVDNEIRAKARARLDATMALLAGKSAARRRASTKDAGEGSAENSAEKNSVEKNSAEKNSADSNASIHVENMNIDAENVVQASAHNPAITHEKASHDAIGEEKERLPPVSKTKTESEPQGDEQALGREWLAAEVFKPTKPEKLDEENQGRILVEQCQNEEEEECKVNAVEERGLVPDKQAERELRVKEETNQLLGEILAKTETVIDNETGLAKEQHEKKDKQIEKCEVRQSAKTEGSKEERGLGTKSKQTELEEKIDEETNFVGQGQDDEEAYRMVCVEAAPVREKLEKSIKQERARNQLKEEKEACRSARTEANCIEEVRLAVEVFKQVDIMRLEEDSIRLVSDEVGSSDGDDTPTIQITQPSISFDPNPNKSSSCSTDTTQLYDKPSEDSDETSRGQVDRILYKGNQGKENEIREDGLPRDESDDREFEAASGSFESGSQPSNIGVFNVSDKEVYRERPPSGGPMWKRAVEEAAFATALANDFLPREAPPSTAIEFDPSPSIIPDPSNLTNKKSLHDDELSYTNYDYHEENQDGWPEESRAAGQDDDMVSIQWKGFKQDRMKLMVALGILGGLLPSFYAVSTCHFITGKAALGNDEVEFGLYYGLGKFTPIDSAFQGYSYCQNYDSKYNYNPPTVARVAGIAAIIFGSIPLIVIGVYLLYSMTHEFAWMGSMWMLYTAFVCQISTLSIFLFDLCQDGIECSMGPGARASGICSVVWFLLSMEMKINSPLIQPVHTGGGVVVIEKDSAIVSEVKKNWRRVVDLIKGEDARTPSLSRTAMKKQKGRIGAVAPSETSSYRAPDIV